MSLFSKDEFEDWIYIDFDMLYQLCNDQVNNFAIQYDLLDKKYTKDLDLFRIHYIITYLIEQHSLPICFVSSDNIKVAKKVSRFIPIIIDCSEFRSFIPSVSTRMKHKMQIPKKHSCIKRLSDKMLQSKLSQLSLVIQKDFNISATLTKY